MMEAENFRPMTVGDIRLLIADMVDSSPVFISDTSRTMFLPASFEPANMMMRSVSSGHEFQQVCLLVDSPDLSPSVDGADYI